MNSELTIVIVAKDAARTIARAAQSALNCGAYPVLLVDDHSTDETNQIAQRILGQRLTIVRTAQACGVGNARHTALANISTPYGMWLDADDELLPHRAKDMLARLKEGADLAFDPVLLFDGHTGKDISTLPIPAFLHQPGGIWRSFERNWIPMLAGGFNVSFARGIGYDRRYLQAEDYDFLLRALMSGAEVALLYDTGYRYAHSPHSLSRDLASSQNYTASAQKKHSLSQLEKKLADVAIDLGEKLFTLACLALNRSDRDRFQHYADMLASHTKPIPPYGRDGQWAAGYLEASALLKVGDYQGAHLRLSRLDVSNNADGMNNLALALWHIGEKEKAKNIWQEALRILPNYLDAASNLAAADNKEPQAFTHFPLRRAPSRSGY